MITLTSQAGRGLARGLVVCAVLAAAIMSIGLSRSLHANGPAAIAPVAVEPDPRRHALATYLAGKYDVPARVTGRVVTEAHAVGAEAGVDPLLILAVVAVESNFKPDARSGYGAQGLMQIVPRFHRERLAEHGGEHMVSDPRVNLTVGTQILQEYVRKTGSVPRGLQRYAGWEADVDRRYARKVLAEKQRLQRVVEQSV
jgi:soluble lytic murein transglycosylase-like protein